MREKEQFEFESIRLIETDATPVYRQLEDHFRQAIARRTLNPGERIPSSRNLASAIGVSRNTVLAAYEQLISEGYLESTRGSGTRVAKMPPEAFDFDSPAVLSGPHQTSDGCLSAVGQQLSEEANGMPPFKKTPKAFTPHLPAVDEFPLKTWNRFCHEQSRWSYEHLKLGDPQGYGPLRESIARYMAVARGVSCDPDQVVITSGSQQAITIAAQLLLNTGDTVWVEDPGNTPASRLLDIAGASVIPLPLDAEGIDLSRIPTRTPKPRLICVTPGGQWPMGMTMSLNRRLELIAIAHRHGSWIIEDDYNGEFRYTGRPHPALTSLDSSGRTIYMGTFSKLLFPAIRLGFLVVPTQFAKAFAYAKFLQDRASPPHVQMVLHRFIESGNFVKHIRRMRSLYADRQLALYRGLQKHFGDLIEVDLPESGMHLVVRGVTKATDKRLVAAANEAKVEYHPVSFYSRSPDAAGMILGFAAFDKQTIRRTVSGWAKQFQQ
ncbi:PLP-dependent aminotransferase family protein [Roseiconus lacunae]|uniref:MocR-like pyridoxine biosynthesis transcription factor PdxR n=1 Tax=Roseiconus lacunae TaxID=2605694 RepID=UPI003092B370|nr:PLP-dependent aminotransferase family protein [Stieleria sp. HD01]